MSQDCPEHRQRHIPRVDSTRRTHSPSWCKWQAPLQVWQLWARLEGGCLWGVSQSWIPDSQLHQLSGLRLAYRFVCWWWEGWNRKGCQAFFFAEQSNKYFDSWTSLVGADGYTPIAGSPLLGTASFAGWTGFDTVSYIGAFDGSNNWMNGWTNFDPQNAKY